MPLHPHTSFHTHTRCLVMADALRCVAAHFLTLSHSPLTLSVAITFRLSTVRLVSLLVLLSPFTRTTLVHSLVLLVLSPSLVYRSPFVLFNDRSSILLALASVGLLVKYITVTSQSPL